jgi:hypothetical protein
VLDCSADRLGLTCNAVPLAAKPERCNGRDDDCDGLVDEDLERACYSGQAGTQGVGQCRAGVQTCQQAADGAYGYTACQGEVTPSAEGCNGLDDDCDGQVDEEHVCETLRLSSGGCGCGGTADATALSGLLGLVGWRRRPRQALPR